ncbi:MAG: ribulose-phosphate 3-epimerase [Lachnospiraceae bacterium]|nr:ribulose-phosphate 3-epimerase [Lachnospiraceae bacterium]
MEYILSPSVLAADFGRMEEQVNSVREAGCKYLHLDVMDGVFVPSISFGMPVISSLRKYGKDLVFDVHLMIVHPKRYIKEFVDCGADIITFHLEACDDEEEIFETIRLIKSFGIEAGVTIKPGTPVSAVKPFLPEIRQFLIMSVEPGFGGQSFMPEAYDRLREARKMIEDSGCSVDLEVDGGVKESNFDAILEAGANVIVAGTAVFRGNIEKNASFFTKKLAIFSNKL